MALDECYPAAKHQMTPRCSHFWHTRDSNNFGSLPHEALKLANHLRHAAVQSRRLGGICALPKISSFRARRYRVLMDEKSSTYSRDISAGFWAINIFNSASMHESPNNL
jgi:hypothetical protein